MGINHPGIGRRWKDIVHGFSEARTGIPNALRHIETRMTTSTTVSSEVSRWAGIEWCSVK